MRACEHISKGARLAKRGEGNQAMSRICRFSLRGCSAASLVSAPSPVPRVERKVCSFRIHYLGWFEEKPKGQPHFLKVPYELVASFLISWLCEGGRNPGNRNLTHHKRLPSSDTFVVGGSLRLPKKPPKSLGNRRALNYPHTLVPTSPKDSWQYATLVVTTIGSPLVRHLRRHKQIQTFRDRMIANEANCLQ